MENFPHCETFKIFYEILAIFCEILAITPANCQCSLWLHNTMRRVLSILFLIYVVSVVESGHHILEKKKKDGIWKLGSNFIQWSRKRQGGGVPKIGHAEIIPVPPFLKFRNGLSHSCSHSQKSKSHTCSFLPESP